MKRFATILSVAAIAVSASAGVGMADEKIKPLTIAKSTQTSLPALLGGGGGLAGLGVTGLAAGLLVTIIVVQATSGTN